MGESMKIPTIDPIVAAIDAAHEAKQGRPRPHLGCSTLGHPCDRWLWLSFRWAVVEAFEGRVLRLFRRGQNEEDTVIDDLRAAGLEVSSQQSRVDFGAHVSGSLDGIVKSGVPQSPSKRHVLEIKTHSKKSFDDLEAKGVEKSKPMHYVQMQVYMYGTGDERALYVAVCKDDDRLYTERVKYDASVAEKAVDRGRRNSLADRMPEPLSTDPTWYQCRFCAAHDFCHVSKTTKRVSCRTCAHSTPKEDSTWRCERHKADGIPVEFQHEGCPSHVLHPDLVPWELTDKSTLTAAVWRLPSGAEVMNGDGGYTSQELLTNPEMCGDPVVDKLRERFDARVTG